MGKQRKQLEAKIAGKKARIAIVGMGYVGLPLACAFASKGYRVTGIDLDPKRVEALKRGHSYVEDIASSTVAKLVRQGKLKAYADYACLGEGVDIVIICVPTPLNKSHDPDISYIVSATEEIEKRLASIGLVILESTTYPGTTDEIILPMLERSGKRAGRDFFLCFSPERIDPGNPHYSASQIPKVVGGITPDCSRLAEALYGKIMPEVIRVSSARTAEMTKILENTFRIVNIGLVNELALAAKSLNVDIWEAIDAAKTKPFGYMPFYPGPGIGGHCIGVDPMYLSWKARMHGTDLQFIELARKINSTMPHHVVSKAVVLLNQFRSKAVSRSRILFLGVAYKKDVADIRESPALTVMQELKALKAKVEYHDPHVPVLEENGFRLKSKPLNAKMLKSYDLAILTTDHSRLNKKMIVGNSKLIFDTRNFFKGIRADNIVRL